MGLRSEEGHALDFPFSTSSYDFGSWKIAFRNKRLTCNLYVFGTENAIRFNSSSDESMSFHKQSHFGLKNGMHTEFVVTVAKWVESRTNIQPSSL